MNATYLFKEKLVWKLYWTKCTFTKTAVLGLKGKFSALNTSNLSASDCSLFTFQSVTWAEAVCFAFVIPRQFPLKVVQQKSSVVIQAIADKNRVIMHVRTAWRLVPDVGREHEADQGSWSIKWVIFQSCNLCNITHTSIHTQIWPHNAL